jgi:hypothetical protein
VTRRRQSELQTAASRADLEDAKRALFLATGMLWPQARAAEGMTELQKQGIGTDCAPPFVSLQKTLDAAAAWVPSEHTRALIDTADVLRRLDASFHFERWLTRPELAQARSVADALMWVEADHEEFLVMYCTKRLGLLGPQLRPYVAQILLGLRSVRGELVLPGDMVAIRNRRPIPLSSFPDDQIPSKLLAFARARMLFDQNARRFVPPCEYQLLAVDELRKVSFQFRWRIDADWNDVKRMLDNRTAGELEQVLDGYSVKDMGKTNYNHFRAQLPRVRKAIFDVQRARIH